LHNSQNLQIPEDGGVFDTSKTDFPTTSLSGNFYGRDVRFVADADASETGLSGTVPDASASDGTDYNLGMIFEPRVDGQITHVRVFSTKEESGDHIVRIYRRDNQQLVYGPVVWNYGGDGHWIELDISSSNIRVSGGIQYVVAVTTPGNQFFPRLGGVFSVGRSFSPNISIPANAGVYSATASDFPSATVAGNCYFRDVRFLKD
jgi:hypothetical protein